MTADQLAVERAKWKRRYDDLEARFHGTAQVMEQNFQAKDAQMQLALRNHLDTAQAELR